MRLVIVVLVLLTMYLQYGLWYTRGGKHDVEKLKTSVAEQKDEIARLKERNRSLSAEVMDLKQGLEAIEERARSEMGMIKNGEVFFRITDPNHEHDQPQNLSGLTKGVEAPLEPPLDPLAPGDAVVADSPDAPPVAQDKPMSVKPMVKAIVNAAAAKSAASAAPAKAAPASAKPVTAASAKPPTTPKAATTNQNVKPTAPKPVTSAPAAPKPVAKAGTTTTAKSAPVAPKPKASNATATNPGAKPVTTNSAPRPAPKASPSPASPPRKAVPVE